MKYFSYLSLLFKQRQWKYIFHFSDIITALFVLISIPTIPSLIERVNEELGSDIRDVIIMFLIVFILSLIFNSVSYVHKTMRSDKVIFYKSIGFRKFDIFLLNIHSFLFSGASISLFTWKVINDTFYKFSSWTIIMIFCFYVLFIFLTLYISISISRRSFSSMKIRNNYRLFKSKYRAFTMKDLSVMLSSPSIILSFCIGGAGVGILIFLNINYLLAFYLICAFSTLGKIDVYNARNHQFLYKFLRITKYDILRYRVAFSVVINTIILLIFTILYISFIGIFTLSEITLLPLIIINALAQHITMDTLLGARKRAYELSTIIYAVLWAITVIPILSTIMYIFAFTKLIKLRKESPYA